MEVLLTFLVKFYLEIKIIFSYCSKANLTSTQNFDEKIDNQLDKALITEEKLPEKLFHVKSN